MAVTFGEHNGKLYVRIPSLDGKDEIHREATPADLRFKVEFQAYLDSAIAAKHGADEAKAAAALKDQEIQQQISTIEQLLAENALLKAELEKAKAGATVLDHLPAQ